jgi:hypothetical protein
VAGVSEAIPDPQQLRVRLDDPRAAHGITADAIAHYLDAHGWAYQSSVSDAEVWMRPTPGGRQVTVRVPIAARAGEEWVVLRLISELALTEDRSELAVRADLLAIAQADHEPPHHLVRRARRHLRRDR